ncbi:MAG: MFS transporter [Zetaproteobacteria bacterium]|nr:MAG: MFS transporter [Zetaproteobacteria bacterium]
MTPVEKRSVTALAGIYSLRMLGLFLILPVFALYAEQLDGVTPTLIGLALGAYGLTMALLQIPFGMLSDRIGRKPVITAGLLIFALGSVVAASTHHIWGVIVGRALQGAGAIAAAMMALLADITREEVRTKATAMIGMSIGISFTASLILGPWLDAAIGVPGIFWLTALLALGAIVVLHTMIPTPAHSAIHRDTETVPAQLGAALRNIELLRLDFGILVLHAIMTAMFIAMPFVLRDQLHLPTLHHSWVYLPTLLVAMGIMVPLVIIAEKKKKMKQVFLTAIGLVALSALLLATVHSGWISVIGGLLIFFIAYNVLEATLPSLVSRIAPIDGKGTAMGVYSTSQFLGAFVGGGGGLLLGHFGVTGIFVACAVAALLWLALAMGMKPPVMRSLVMLHFDAAPGRDANALEQALLEQRGIFEVRVISEEQTVYLRVEKEVWDIDKARAILAGR